MIIRGPRPEGHFTILRNVVLRDERLSFRARGILACVLSRPDDWRTTSETLAKQSGGREGRDAIRTALKELEKAGYLRRYKINDKVTGQITTVTYIFDEPTENGLAEDGSTDAGKSVPFKKTILRIERKRNSSKSEKTNIPPPFVPFDQEKHCMHGFIGEIEGGHSDACPWCRRGIYTTVGEYFRDA